MRRHSDFPLHTGRLAAIAANRGRPRDAWGAGDPATAERLYSDEESAFLRAMDVFIQCTGNRFPTFCDCLGVARSLGYQRPTELPSAVGTP